MNRRRIRLAVLLQDLEFGGTQRYALNLLGRIDREQFDPVLWVLRGGDDMLPLARQAGIEVEYVTRDRRVGLGTLWALWQKLGRDRPDLLYTLTVVPNIWGRLFAAARGVRVVSGYRNLMPRQKERWLWRLSRRVICNAEVLKEVMIRVHGVGPARIAVVPNGVDLSLFPSREYPEDENPVILYAGRLVPQKDPLNLLRAFSLLANDFPSARLRIVGNGPLRKNLEAFIASNNLAGRVELLPGVRDLRPYFKEACMFCLPASSSEGSPNVVIEAMAAGLPVVATGAGGTFELIHSGQTGLLVSTRDSSALAGAMAALLDDPSTAAKLGRSARKYVEAHHDLWDTVRLTETILSKAMEPTNAA